MRFQRWSWRILMLEGLICEVEKVKPSTISIIGAGGKTTLMYRLAETFARNKKVLVTTTTHICQPEGEEFVETLEGVRGRWMAQQYAVVGQPTNGGKLKSLGNQKLKAFMKEAELVLVEADGAKRMPCKVANTTEPVLLPETDMVIMVLGMDALGRRMRDVCFRCELAMDLLEEERDHVMTEEDFLVIIRNQMEDKLNLGDQNLYIVLNKCDNKKRKTQGERIKRILEEEERYHVYLTHLLSK